MTLTDWGTIIAIVSTVLVGARMVFVTEERNRQQGVALTAAQTDITQLKTLLATLDKEQAASGRDMHALRNTIHTDGLRMQKVFDELKLEMRDGFKSIRHDIAVALGEHTNPGG